LHGRDDLQIEHVRAGDRTTFQQIHPSSHCADRSGQHMQTR
jgi:hypothetical protein